VHPRPPKKPRTWIAYRIRGAKAAWLGHVEAADREAAIATVAAACRRSASWSSRSSITERTRWLRRGEVIGEVVNPKPSSGADCFIRCP